MLDANMKTQLKAYLEKLTKPVELIATLDDSAKSAEIKALLTEIAELSPKVTFKEDNTLAVRKPSFLIANPGSDQGPRFAGSPLGHEFTSLVLALLWTGGHPSKEAQALLEQIRDIDGDFEFETYYSLSCHNCPDVVQALNLMSVLNPRIKHTAIDGGTFQCSGTCPIHSIPESLYAGYALYWLIRWPPPPVARQSRLLLASGLHQYLAACAAAGTGRRSG